MEGPENLDSISQCLNISRCHHKQLLFQNHNQNRSLCRTRRQLQIPNVDQGIQAQLLHRR
uniref:Uncharacterized protein n=1 Tax=Arundo donax TaxID=35708 RepID=A0A0A9AIV4_ARUDO